MIPGIDDCPGHLISQDSPFYFMRRQILIRHIEYSIILYRHFSLHFYSTHQTLFHFISIFDRISSYNFIKTFTSTNAVQFKINFAEQVAIYSQKESSYD
jgi:hypothetical protein